MKIAADKLDDASRKQLTLWGWEIVDDLSAPGLDAILSTVPATSRSEAPWIVVTAEPSVYNAFVDDFLLPPLSQAETETRIANARRRRERLKKWIHDLRASLNAAQGYAELIQETASGESVRFAANICRATQQLTRELQSIRDRSD